MLFGLVPAFQRDARRVVGTLKESGRGAVTSRGGAPIARALVVVEMALAVMLLAGAGLLMRSFVAPAVGRSGLQAGAGAVVRAVAARCALQGGAAADRVLRRSCCRGCARCRACESTGAVMAPAAERHQLHHLVRDRGPPAVPPAQQPAMEVRVATPGYFNDDWHSR